MPKPTWFYWKSPPLDGALNMAWDEICLHHASTLDAPLLRFYEWASPTTTFGYFQSFQHVQSQANPSELIRRPTGGGIVPHSNDWTYSLVFPPSCDWYHIRAKESYLLLHRWLQEAFASLHIETQLNNRPDLEGPGSCFIGAETNDLLWQGKKLAGAAQRRRKEGFLIQGSIQPPPPTLKRPDWESALLNAAQERWKIEWTQWTPPPPLKQKADELEVSKYRSRKYNQRR